MSNPTFDPQWVPLHNLMSRRMLFNDKAHAEQTQAACNQLEAVTQIINQYEERIEALESRLGVLEKDTTILQNTNPQETKRGPGRPPKATAEKERA